MNIAAKAIMAFSLLLGGCTTLLETGRQVDGWPQLSIMEHRIGWHEVIARCSQYSRWWTWPPFGCSEFDLRARRADIWCAFDWACEAERRYMAGKEHPTDTVMADAVKGLN